MIRLFQSALAAALSLTLAAGPVLAAPFSSYPAAPPPDGTALGLAWQGGPTVVTTNSAWSRANLGVAKVRTLESFAVAAGTTLGSADDGAVITAANTAIIAAKSSGGLVVMLPAGQFINTSVGLLLDNNGGWSCPIMGACQINMVRSNSDASATWAVSLNDPHATSVVLSGIRINGGWNQDWQGTGPKAAWLYKQGGVNLSQAYNGSGDSSYIANSAMGLQEPSSFVHDLYIANFGGDCMDTAGAGALTFHNIRAENCGGVGLSINTYDSKWSDIDIGSTGLSAIVCGAAGCANDSFEGIKGWYAGQGRNPAHDHGIEVYGNSNDFEDINIQDSSGDGLWEDNDFNNTFVGVVQWQGCIPWMDAQVAGIRTGGGDHNHHLMKVNIPPGTYPCQPAYPNVTAAIKDERATTNAFNLNYTRFDTFDLLVSGLPNDNYGLVRNWIIGPLDLSNRLTVNGAMRQPNHWQEDFGTGNFNMGLPMNGSAVGMVVDGQNGFYPGQVTILAQNAGGQLAGFANTATASTGTLTATSNFSDGDTVTIGAKTWTFRATLTTTSSTGTGAPNEVHIGPSAAVSIANLRAAINARRPAYLTGYISGATLNVINMQTGALSPGDLLSGGYVITSGAAAPIASGTVLTGSCALSSGQGPCPINISQTAGGATAPVQMSATSGLIGTDYSYGTVPSVDVTAADNGAGVLTVTDVTLGVNGNGVATGASTSHASWSAPSLSGGAAGAQTYSNAVTWDVAGHPFLPGLIAAPALANNAAACAAGYRNGQIWRDSTDSGGVLHIASCP